MPFAERSSSDAPRLVDMHRFLAARGVAAVLAWDRAEAHKTAREGSSGQEWWWAVPVADAYKRFPTMDTTQDNPEWTRGYHGTHLYGVAAVLADVAHGARSGLLRPPDRAGVYLHKSGNRGKCRNYCIATQFVTGSWWFCILDCQVRRVGTVVVCREQLLVARPDHHLQINAICFGACRTEDLRPGAEWVFAGWLPAWERRASSVRS